MPVDDRVAAPRGEQDLDAGSPIFNLASQVDSAHSGKHDVGQEKLDLAVNLIPYRREEVFSYYVRLGKPRPDLIVIRSHFHSLVNSLNQQKCIPTIVVSTHQKPTDCLAPFIRAHEGYEGPHASNAYKMLALTMRSTGNQAKATLGG